MYVTIDMVRNELQDRTPADNTIDCDLAFTDEEIKFAMKRAADAYNSMSPIGVDYVSPNCLPADTTVFLDATLTYLYKAHMHRLARNQLQWQTGDTTVEFEKTRMQNYSQLMSMLEKEWKEAAKERKMEINRSMCYGMF